RQAAHVVTHGTRRGYRQGCRCLPCAHAEAVYRRHPRVAPVEGTPAPRRLQPRAARGLGPPPAARLAGVPRAPVQSLSTRRRVRAATTVAAVLAIPAQPAPGALVSACRVRQLLAWFRLEGFSNAEVARRLGLRSPQLQFVSPRCTYRSAARVRALYRKVAEM